jgi:hypothetical protein
VAIVISNEGFVLLDEVGADEFVERCRAIRFWTAGGSFLYRDERR